MEGNRKDSDLKTGRFLKTLEAGDIALLELFEEAMAVFGFTKVGKTTSCHLITGCALKAEDQRGELVYRTTTSRYANAKIGNTTESETEIPNIFETLIREKGVVPAKFKKVKLLDQPGYGDSYGFHRIFSNGYFHYRTFSKTPKLKFILAFSKDDLNGTAQKFKRTISNFINSFSGWENISQDILKATSFLITKTDPNSNQENIVSKISDLRTATNNMSQQQMQRYIGIIDEMLRTNRIYLIEKPIRANQSPLESPILQRIYDESEFWVRPVMNNIADMKEINFSVSEQILRELRDRSKEVFRKDFIKFMESMETRRLDMIIGHSASLVNIVKALQRDAVDENDSRSFLDEMKYFIKDYYCFLDQYKDKREKAEVNLFESPQAERWNQVGSAELDKQMRSVYFIKKFKVIELLQAINKKVEDTMISFSRSIEELEDFSNLFIAIFRQFSILRDNARDKTIYKYSYIIQRVIEESKILALILFTNDEVKQEIERLDIKTFSEDIFRTLKDKFFTNILGDINSNSLKEQFITNTDFSSLTVVNEEVISFFESIPNKSEAIKIKNSELISQYVAKIFKNDRDPTDEEKKFATVKLFHYRNDFYAYLKNMEVEEGFKESRQRVIEIIFRLSNSLGLVLSKHSLYLARECYKSINNADLVFQMYELECRTKETERQAHRELLIQYSEEANRYCRKELSMRCCQKAYALSSSYAELKEISKLIEKFCTEKEEDNAEYNEDPQAELTYLQRLSREQFCSDFSKQLRDSIEIKFLLDEEE